MTVHIITHHSGESLSGVRKNLKTFINGHMSWISSVGGMILGKKKIKIEDYCNDLQEMVTPIDQLGLLILGRMYHRHFTVFLKDSVWSTRRDNGTANSTIYFAYHGGTSFSDTVEDPDAADKLPGSASEDNIEVLNETPLNLSGPPAARRTSPPRLFHSESTSLSESDDEQNNKQSGLFDGNENTQQSGVISDEDYEPPGKQRRLQEPTAKPKKPIKSGNRGRKPKPNKPKKKTKAQLALERKLKRQLKKKEEEERKAYENNLRSKFDCTDCDVALEKLEDPPLSPRKAKPNVEDLKEKDPLLEAFKDVRPDEVDSLLHDDEAPTKGSTSKISEEKHETNDGTITFAKYGARKHKKIDKHLKCVASDCEEVFPYVKELNHHLKSKHPHIKFKCKYCPKVYDCYNSRYKHEATHFELPYRCHFCEKRFQFPKQREKHERQHTGKSLLPCTWPGCKSKLSCTDALNQHLVTHTDERFPCPSSNCEKDFNTLSILKQHLRGKHGDGFISYCGSSFDWSDSRTGHQRECDDCKKRIYDMSHKPQFPRKKKQWRRSVAKDDEIPFVALDNTTNSDFSDVQETVCYFLFNKLDLRFTRSYLPLSI